MAIPADYLERVYAGVLGKLIGVYVGRPFEGWTYQRILRELGPIQHYVHEKLDMPLVVIDDDVSGTFVFVRALLEHGNEIGAEEIGKTWLNTVIERKTIFWWGGYGISTEHTAYLNLKRGISAPKSGSIATNGRTVAEQIGAQIFIDGWALVAPGNPQLAAKLARAAGEVSHDGAAVDAAVLWAAMEAEAFVVHEKVKGSSKSVADHLLDVGLSFIPKDSAIVKLVADVRAWVAAAPQDWQKTRARIEQEYGYDKYCGVCHVMPNHGIMVMALLYAAEDFHAAMHIINTSGWDTDCNSGNLGCLVGLVVGLKGIDEGGPDWRGPLADRAIISCADAGYGINNAARIALDLVDLGRRLAGETTPVPRPKDGAQFHFALPGSVQGFQAKEDSLVPGTVTIEQEVDTDNDNRPGLAIRFKRLATRPAEVLTDTFSRADPPARQTYDLVASPLVFPGQTVRAAVRAATSNTGPVQVRLRLRYYTPEDALEVLDSPDSASLAPGASGVLEWTLPNSLDNQPIQQLGVVVSSAANVVATTQGSIAAQSLAEGRPVPVSGTVWLDYVRWDGAPSTTFVKPPRSEFDFSKTQLYDHWYRAFVSSADTFHRRWMQAFRLAQDRGEGVVYQGNRDDWLGYKVHVPDLVIALVGKGAGVVVRAQGLNRYYAVVFVENTIKLIKARDADRTEIASAKLAWRLDEKYDVTAVVDGSSLSATVVGPDGEKAELAGTDSEYEGGGAGFVVTEGSSLAASILEIRPLK